jgi:hypothetical protein
MFGVMAGASAEEARTVLGVLTCTVVKPADGQSRNISCGFKPTGTGAEEKYSGSVRGAQMAEPAGKMVLVWTVQGPATDKLAAGFLAQRYAPAESVPGKAPALVGGKNPVIALQPETNTDTGSFAAIEVELILTGTPA